MKTVIREKATRTRALILDVDGVLTDGRLYYGETGEAFKAFNVKDGLGIQLLIREKIPVAVISARNSPALRKRLNELHVQHMYLGRSDKLACLDELQEILGITSSEMAYCGDDILDLPVLRNVGLSISIADGHYLVREEVDWVTKASGGHGAVREIADALLYAQGRLDESIENLLREKTKR